MNEEIEDGCAEEHIARFAAQVADGLLVPACRATDYQERWKAVNRAAGVIVGWVASFDPELVDPVRLAQHLTDACLKALDRRRPNGSIPPYDRHVVEMIAGPNGLVKRVAECLLALGVGR